METTPNGWTIVDRDAAVLFQEYQFNDAGGRATTFVTRLKDGKLLAISPAVGLPEGAFSELAEFGEVGAIVAPNGFHHLGQQEWRERFPSARNFAAPEAAARIAKKGAAGLTFEPMSALAELLPDDVGVTEAPATKVGETWAWAKTADGYAWFASDLICNWQKFPGNAFLNFMWKLSKSGPGYKLFHFAMMVIVKDKKRLLAKFHEDLKAHPPTLVVPAHGPHAHHDGIGQETIQMVAAAL